MYNFLDFEDIISSFNLRFFVIINKLKLLMKSKSWMKEKGEKICKRITIIFRVQIQTVYRKYWRYSFGSYRKSGRKVWRALGNRWWPGRIERNREEHYEANVRGVVHR